VRIIEHADVKRMLLAQKAYGEGALALMLHCARLVDEQHTGTPEDADEARLLLEVLTPIAKSWPSEFCLEANSLAIQVHGGYGYTRDFPVEQYWRDNRLNMIHEGTHGIQAADLLGRKVVMEGGKGLHAAGRPHQRTIERAIQRRDLAEHANALARRCRTSAPPPRRPGPPATRPAALANAVPYMQAFGHTGDRLDLARRGAHGACPPQGAAQPAQTGRVRAARYFFHYELPKIGAWLKVVETRDPTCADHAGGRVLTMASARTLARIDALIWVLIYGGLFARAGHRHARRARAIAGWSAGRAGRCRHAAGVVLIFVRSRLREASASGAQSSETMPTRNPMTRTVQQLFDLKGKTALITGGSRGLGLQLAHALGEAGARIMLTSRKASDLEEAAADLQAAGIDARWIAADCSREEDIRAGRPDHRAHGRRRHPGEQRRRRLGRAGRGPPGGSLGQGDEPQRPRLFHPQPAHRQAQHDPAPVRPHHQHRLHRRPGRQPARDADPGVQHVQGRGHQLHPALARMGQVQHHVNAICPGFFPSKMTKGTLERIGEDKLAAHAPLRRLGDDEDLKGTALLFASDAGKHITGQWLAVDGGVSMVTGADGHPKLSASRSPSSSTSASSWCGWRTASRARLRAAAGAHELVPSRTAAPIMTLLDVTMATAARSVEMDMGVVTIEMKTSFMQPCAGRCRQGRLMHRTATMAFTEGTHLRRRGPACAHATGTFKYVKRLPIGPRARNVNISTD
jgi:acyl-coenzyme A thioesterase PaaI-like protein